MIEKILRFLGSACILAAVLVMFLPSIISLEDVSRKDLRESRAQTLDDLEKVEEAFLSNLSYYETELDDNDLPHTKASIKKVCRRTEELVRTVLDDEVSFKEIAVYAYELPKYLNHCENLLEARLCFEYAMENAVHVRADDFSETIESALPYRFVGSVVLVFFALILLMAIAAIVTNILHKADCFKYILFALFLGLTVLLIVLLPMVSDALASGGTLPPIIEDMTLRITAMPFVATALSFVPIVIEIVWKVLSVRAKKEEA